MAKANTYGDAGSENVWLESVAVTNGVPVSCVKSMEHMDHWCATLVYSGGSVAGSWKFYVSNLYTTGGQNQPPNDGSADWTEITAGVLQMNGSAVAAVAAAGKQAVHFPHAFPGRALKIEFNPTASGTVAVYGFAKGNR